MRPRCTTAAALKIWPPTDTARPSTNTVGASAVSVAKRSSSLALADQEAGPLHEIFGRVAADRLFGKRADGDVGVGHLLRDRDQPRDVGANGANRGTDAGHRQFGQPHI